MPRTLRGKMITSTGPVDLPADPPEVLPKVLVPDAPEPAAAVEVPDGFEWVDLKVVVNINGEKYGPGRTLINKELFGVYRHAL